MGSFSLWHWLVVLAIVLLLFGGRGKISQLMGDFGKGLKAFKKGVSDEQSTSTADNEQTGSPRTIGEGSTASGGVRKDETART